MSPEAQTILNFFKERNCKTGDRLHQGDFGDRILSDPEKEAIRDAVTFLCDHGYIVPHIGSVELSQKGFDHLRPGG